jgi:putative phosphoesterase
MKIAILADIHGNSLALDATLADLRMVGIDENWILGDIVALGPDPIGVLQRLIALPNCKFIRGNTDRYVVTGDRPPPFPADLGQDSEMIRIFAEVAGTFAWTQGAITAAGWLDWLSQLSLELKTLLPDGTNCLCVHAHPGNDDGMGIQQDFSDDEIQTLVKECTADLICVGHTHQRIDRKVGKWRIVNPGSISNPRPPILEASYAILDASSDGYEIEHRAAEYDRE